MGTTAYKSISWPDTDSMESTSDSNLSMSVLPEEVPTLTVATIVGMIVIMLVAIATVFLLGVLIDWRHQRLLEKKMGESKRLKYQRQVNTNSEDDSANIANNMEQPGMSVPPVEIITNIP